MDWIFLADRPGVGVLVLLEVFASMAVDGNGGLK